MVKKEERITNSTMEYSERKSPVFLVMIICLNSIFCMLGMVAHICKPSVLEAEIGGL
jgi:hypothetical protein